MRGITSECNKTISYRPLFCHTPYERWNASIAMDVHYGGRKKAMFEDCLLRSLENSSTSLDFTFSISSILDWNIETIYKEIGDMFILSTPTAAVYDQSSPKQTKINYIIFRKQMSRRLQHDLICFSGVIKI